MVYLFFLISGVSGSTVVLSVIVGQFCIYETAQEAQKISGVVTLKSWLSSYRYLPRNHRGLTQIPNL